MYFESFSSLECISEVHEDLATVRIEEERVRKASQRLPGS